MTNHDPRRPGAALRGPGRRRATELFESLAGKTLTTYRYDGENGLFLTFGDETYVMRHDQSCCEKVSLETSANEMDALVGQKIHHAYVNARQSERLDKHGNLDGTMTWTFYVLQGGTSCVVLRWVGSSNGYYSEEVDFSACPPRPAANSGK